jgi:poly(3-hydroxybutyrate) depolymerase
MNDSYQRGRFVRQCLQLAFALAGLGMAVDAAHAAPPETGHLERSYYLDEAQASMPYRLYVPTSYDGTKPYPLVVVLHGSSTVADDVIKAPGLESLAEARNIILLAPQGYSAFGGYGDIYPVVVTREAAARAAELLQASLPNANAPKGMTRPKAGDQPAAPEDYAELPANGLIDPRASRLSELDTMKALELVKGEYRIDPSRIYLMGNSMGAMGTAYLAVRYPEVWAAISPSGGPFAAWSYPYSRLRDNHIAALFVHGDKDEHAHWQWSQRIVDLAKKEGVDARLLVVPGGTHVDAWRKALPQIFDFFLEHRK